jgi:hypothetical protein
VSKPARKRFRYAADLGNQQHSPTSSQTSHSSQSRQPVPVSDSPNTSAACLPTLDETDWLNDEHIYQLINNNVKSSKHHFALCVPAATSIVTKGTCNMGRRMLSKFKLVYGAVNLNGNHWLALFVDMTKWTVSVIDPLGHTKACQEGVDLWQKFASTRSDLAGLTFEPRVYEHPTQRDGYNCGVFVAQFLIMLLGGQEINKDSFDMALIDSPRATLTCIA